MNELPFPDRPAAAGFDAPGFEDGKDPDAFRTIGEVAKAFNLRQHVLRYWEEQFPMLRPLTRAGGRRYYRAQDVALIAEISRLLYHEGFTIRGARQALAGWGKSDTGSRGTEQSDGGKEAVSAPIEQSEAVRPVAAAPEATASPIASDIAARLHEVRRQLAEALEA